jgi:hypothetical protein
MKMKIKRKNINLTVDLDKDDYIEFSGFLSDKLFIFYLNHGEVQRLKKLIEKYEKKRIENTHTMVRKWSWIK